MVVEDPIETMGRLGIVVVTAMAGADAETERLADTIGVFAVDKLMAGRLMVGRTITG